jgi:hypothetical protein
MTVMAADSLYECLPPLYRLDSICPEVGRFALVNVLQNR